MDRNSMVILVAVCVVYYALGLVAALILLLVLFALGFVLASMLRAIVGANVPEGLSHKTDELTLYFFYTAMTRNATGTPQPMMQGGSDQGAYTRFMRQLNNLPAFKMVSDAVALIGAVICYPAFAVFKWFTTA